LTRLGGVYERVELLWILADRLEFCLAMRRASFGRMWYGEPNAISNAKFRSRSHPAIIRVYDESSNVIETHEHAGEFALLRLMAPLNAIARQLLAYFYAIDITAAGIRAVAAITFAPLTTVLHAGTILRPIG
jgi:hypothetical protein